MTWTLAIPYRTVLFAGAAVLAMSVSAQAQTLVLNYNQWFPVGHWSQKDGLYKYFDEIKRVTEGRVTVQPSAKPLAPPNHNYAAVVDGVADIAWGPQGYMPGMFPLTEMVELPFMTEDAGKSSVAYWRVWEKYLAPTGMQNEVITLAMHVTSGGNIHTREKPVTSIADLKGAKLRVPTPVVGRVLKAIGGVPVSGSLGELQEMLSRGIVDGTAISDELVIGFKVQDAVKAVTRIPGGLYSNSAFIIMNKEKWDKISPQDQAAITAISGEKLSAMMGQLWHTNDLAAREIMKSKLGDAYQEASPTFVSELKQAFAGEQDAWLKVAAKAGIDGQAVVDYYTAQLQSLSQ